MSTQTSTQWAWIQFIKLCGWAGMLMQNKTEKFIMIHIILLNLVQSSDTTRCTHSLCIYYNACSSLPPLSWFKIKYKSSLSFFSPHAASRSLIHSLIIMTDPHFNFLIFRLLLYMLSAQRNWLSGLVRSEKIPKREMMTVNPLFNRCAQKKCSFFIRSLMWCVHSFVAHICWIFFNYHYSSSTAERARSQVECDFFYIAQLIITFCNDLTSIWARLAILDYDYVVDDGRQTRWSAE